jgi:hypothetical protein
MLATMHLCSSTSLRGIALGLMGLFVLPAPAFAECDGPVGAHDLLASYQTVQFMMASGDTQAVVDAGEELETGLACLTDRVPPALFAGVYRALGVSHAFAEQKNEAMQWFLTARQLDSTSTFGVDEMPIDSPVRALFDAAIANSVIAPVRVPGMTLSPPPNSLVLLDGREIQDAAATPNRYHLIQLAHADGRIRRSWIILGNAFPAILLQASAVETEDVAQVTKEDEPESALQVMADEEGMPTGYDMADFVRIDRDRPPWKTPSMVSGGTTIAGSLLLYGASFYTQSRFDGATTENDLYNFQRLTNRLTVGASVLFVLGGAAGSWGVMMNGGTGLGFRHTW